MTFTKAVKMELNTRMDFTRRIGSGTHDKTHGMTRGTEQTKARTGPARRTSKKADTRTDPRVLQSRQAQFREWA